MDAFLLTAVVFTVLWLFWKMLNWVFDLIDQHARLRAEDVSTRKGSVN